MTEQLYFLSILCNGLSGYLLFAGNGDNDGNGGYDAGNTGVSFSLRTPVFSLVLGILSAVIGALKLLSPFDSKFYIFGDLVPAIAGVTAGLLLIFGIYRNTSSEISGLSETSGTLDRLAKTLLRSRKPLGLALLGVALLHFLFPQALFI